MEILPVFPCAYGNDTAADGRRRMISVSSVGVSCCCDNYDAFLPEPLYGFFQRQVDLSVVGADGKIYYLYIIFASIVHYPSQCRDCLDRIALPKTIQDFYGNDIGAGGDAAVFSVGIPAVAAGDTRDMGHGCKKGIKRHDAPYLFNKESKGDGRMKGEQAALYCRLSVEDADRGTTESESIQNQKALLLDYAARRGWEIYDIYADEDYSGLREDRPAFQRMLQDAREGRFSIILCKTQSRFTRNAVTAERYLHEQFPCWGIRFVTVVDHVDTAFRANKKARQINSLVNEWYSEELSENIRAVLRRKREQGQFLGNYAPYGYRKDPLDRHHLVKDEETAMVVEMIYDLYLSGLSCKMIAERLTEKAIPTPSQVKKSHGEDLGRKDCNRWAAGTVRKILRNPVYLGHMVQGREEKISFKERKNRELPKNRWIVVENTHEAVIKQDVFDTVGRLMEKRRRSSPVK